MRGEPLGDHFTMPVWDGDFFRMLRDAVPERLNVCELVVR